MFYPQNTQKVGNLQEHAKKQKIKTFRFLHPASANGVIVLTSCDCVCVSHSHGLTDKPTDMMFDMGVKWMNI